LQRYNNIVDLSPFGLCFSDAHRTEKLHTIINVDKIVPKMI